MTSAASSSALSRIDAISAPKAIAAAAAGALIVNLVLWLIGLAAGGDFETVDNGKAMTVAPGGVVVLTLIPLIVGLTAAALLAVKWPVFIRIAQVLGAIAALGTVALTIKADFDGPSTVALALMHVVVALAVIAGLEAVRNGRLVR